MKRTGKIALISAAFAFAVIPLLSQTMPAKPSFEVTVHRSQRKTEIKSIQIRPGKAAEGRDLP